jgi:hypothetical protein
MPIDGKHFSVRGDYPLKQSRRPRAQAHKSNCLRFVEVSALWAAAVVGVVAILVSSVDSKEKMQVIQGQLDEMRSQQRPVLWVISRLGAPTYIPNDLGKGRLVWTVHLTNYGKNIVAGGTLRAYMRLGNEEFAPSFGEPNAGEPLSPVAPGQEITYSVVSRPGITKDDIASFRRDEATAQIKLLADYSDLAGAGHRTEICLSLSNGDSAAFCATGNRVR